MANKCQGTASTLTGGAWLSACETDGARFIAFFHAMLDQGIYLAPSPFEAGFVTTAHGDAELDQTLEAARRAFRKVS
jgi:glutamate-1-semialdehyde 2,1-aminomutase